LFVGYIYLPQQAERLKQLLTPLNEGPSSEFCLIQLQAAALNPGNRLA